MKNIRKTSHSSSPTSFSFHVLPGEALIYYPRTTYTPSRSSFYVQVSTEPLTTGLIETWFIESVESLVGKEATGILVELLERNPEQKAELLEAALKCRRDHG